MSVRFKLSDINEKEQNKLEKYLSFTPQKSFNAFNKFSNDSVESVRMFFVKEKIVHLPFYFSNIYYKKTFNQTKNYPTIFENRNGKFKGKLLDRQVEPFKNAVEHLKEFKTTTIALYPGFGKTFLGVMLSWYYNLKTCVLVHRDNVGVGWLKTYKNCFDIDQKEITWVDEKGRYNREAKIFVVMDTRVKKIEPEIIRQIGLLIIDEAHLFCSKSRVEPLLSFKPKYVIAETATPTRTDGMHKMIQSICGTHYIEKISDKPYNFYLIKTNLDFPIEEGTKTIFNDLLNGQFESEVRNDLIVKLLETNKDKKAIIITKFKNHCKHLKALIEEKGLESSELYGNIKKYEPKNILIGTGSKMGVGFDEANFCDDFDGRPSDLLIITYSFKSMSTFEQIRGRGMRAEKPNVVMFTDNNPITKRHFGTIKNWVKKTNGKIHLLNLKDMDYKL